MEIARFGAIKLHKIGRKSNDEVNPLMNTAPGLRAMRINTLLSNILDITEKDRIAIFSIQWGEKVIYIATKGFIYNDVEQGALIGNNNTFNYGGVYESLLAGGTTENVTKGELIKSGLLLHTNDTTNGKVYKATTKCFAKLDGHSTLGEIASLDLDYEDADRLIDELITFLNVKDESDSIADVTGTGQEFAFLTYSHSEDYDAKVMLDEEEAEDEE